jgi:hypothetical protein
MLLSKRRRWQCAFSWRTRTPDHPQPTGHDREGQTGKLADAVELIKRMVAKLDKQFL